jgi:hypothetical protein
MTMEATVSNITTSSLPSLGMTEDEVTGYQTIDLVTICYLPTSQQIEHFDAYFLLLFLIELQGVVDEAIHWQSGKNQLVPLFVSLETRIFNNGLAF